MTTKWDHLPNAKHIDRVLASVTANPELWSAAKDATRNAAWEAARDAVDEAARNAVWNATRNAVWKAVWKAAWDAARDVAWNAAWNAARDAAWDAMLALVAYDDCAHMLDSDIGELKILAAFGDPRATLLLPACIAFAKEKEMKLTSKSGVINKLTCP